MQSWDSDPGSFLDTVIDKLAARLDAHRLHHSLGTFQAAMMLAKANGVDAMRVAPAALLHDCAKGLQQEQLKQLASRDPKADPSDFRFPPLLHASAGAVLAHEEFGIEDEEILDAIRVHPTGRGNPSDLLCVLMAADYTEPTRYFPGLEEAREEIRRDLREGLLKVLRLKAEYVISRGKEIHPRIYDMIHSLEGGRT